MKIKLFSLLAFIFSWSCFSMSVEPQQLLPEEKQEKLAIKATITQVNFDIAMNAIKARPGGVYLAEKLARKLKRFINKEVLAEDWGNAVHKAYQEIVGTMGPPGISIIAGLPADVVFEDILRATFPELFSSTPPPPQA